MHILLTDILTCPQCGPEYGLILLPDAVRERRVQAGVLGCPNCRQQYPVRDGGCELGGEPLVGATADAERGERLAALLGVVRGPGVLLLVGPASADAGLVAQLVPDVEVIACGWGGEAGPVAEQAGVSRIGIAGSVLPLVSGRIAGVALTGDAADALLEEGVRVLSPLGRLVLEPAPVDAAERVAKGGLRVVAQDERTLVAARA